VLTAVAREEGKMNASGATSLVADRHYSSSVSTETGSQALLLLPLGLGFNFDSIRDAAVNAKTVIRLLVPPECKKLAWPESEHQEHANNQSVAVTQIEKNDGNLLSSEGERL
jgi:hypothetical protein